MKVNIKAIEELLNEKFDGNQTAFAEAIKVERTHVNKVLKNDGKGAGALFCGAIIKYCNENNLNFNDYIFLN